MQFRTKKWSFSRKSPRTSSCLLVSRETFASLERKSYQCRKRGDFSNAKHHWWAQKGHPGTQCRQRKASNRKNAAVDGHEKAAQTRNAANGSPPIEGTPPLTGVESPPRYITPPKKVAADGRSAGKKKNRRTSRAAGFEKRSFPYLFFVWASAKGLFRGVAPAHSGRKGRFWPRCRAFRAEGAFSVASLAHSGEKARFQPCRRAFRAEGAFLAVVPACARQEESFSRATSVSLAKGFLGRVACVFREKGAVFAA